MRFTVIGHACLYIETGRERLLVDPWLSGSCYWRSWWHFPPNTEVLPEFLDPDYVYLSRVHPRDSAQRLGDPFAPARFLDGRAETVWWRPGPDGTPQAALFKVRAQALEGGH